MRNVALVMLLLAVATVFYGLGRRHGGAAREPGPATAKVIDSQPEVSKSGVRRRVPRVSEQSPASDPGMPFAQKVSSFAQGFEAARENLDEALRRIESLPVSERMGFTTGIFSFVARNHTPADALAVYKRAPEAFRPYALRALVGEWIYTRSPLDEDRRSIQREGALTVSGYRVGLEVELSSMLASAKPDAELASAWLAAFASHGSRSEMLLRLGDSLGSNKGEALLSQMEGWTAWEKERVMKSFLGHGMGQSPKETWDWYQANRSQFEQDFSSSILERWASTDPAGLQGLLNGMEQPAQRKAAIEALGKALARKNTDEAVNWANSLADAGERATANQAVYDGAPRGIGAVLGIEQGFPVIRGVVPGSPLDGSGVHAGDQLVEIWEANGAKQNLYARDLSATVELIRGEPGSELTLRLLRQNKTGQWEEHLVPVRRGQLYLNEKELPERSAPQGP